HINVELRGPVQTWSDLVELAGRIRNKAALVEDIFGPGVRMLTTYSYHQGVPLGADGVPAIKQYFPLNVTPHNALVVVDPAQDLGTGLLEEQSFDAAALRSRERSYT